MCQHEQLKERENLRLQYLGVSNFRGSLKYLGEKYIQLIWDVTLDI